MQFPETYKYIKEHTWLKLEGDNIATIGITEFAQSELGEIVYVDLPSTGTLIKKDEVFGSVEALKTTSDLFAPVSGRIVAVNKEVVTNPELVNSSSFDEGWMIQIELTDTNELTGLLDANAYRSFVQ